MGFFLRVHKLIEAVEGYKSCYSMEGGAPVTNNQSEPTKADVQATELNKMPVPGKNDTEFSAEEAAEVFEQNQSSANRTIENKQQ